MAQAPLPIEPPRTTDKAPPPFFPQDLPPAPHQPNVLLYLYRRRALLRGAHAASASVNKFDFGCERARTGPVVPHARLLSLRAEINTTRSFVNTYRGADAFFPLSFSSLSLSPSLSYSSFLSLSPPHTTKLSYSFVQYIQMYTNGKILWRTTRHFTINQPCACIIL